MLLPLSALDVSLKFHVLKNVIRTILIKMSRISQNIQKESFYSIFYFYFIFILTSTSVFMFFMLSQSKVLFYRMFSTSIFFRIYITRSNGTSVIQRFLGLTSRTYYRRAREIFVT